MVAPLRSCGQNFVVLWSKLRDPVVKTSWSCGQNFVVLWLRSSGAIQRPPKLFMDFQVCSGTWFEGGVGIIRIGFRVEGLGFRV